MNVKRHTHLAQIYNIAFKFIKFSHEAKVALWKCDHFHAVQGKYCKTCLEKEFI